MNNTRLHTKIGELQFTTRGDEQILWLEIPMQHTSLMAIV
jgi:hypothetical protein